MNSPTLPVVACVLLAISSLDAASADGRAETRPSALTVVERGAHQRVWEQDDAVQLSDGRVVNRPRRMVERASGLHYRDDTGQWVESRDEIESAPTGAAATRALHRLHLNAHANSEAAVTVTTPEGLTLRTRTVGLAYTVNGQSVLFAPVRSSAGLFFRPTRCCIPMRSRAVP